MQRAIKWLIFTNLYIAIAAICFQGVAYFLNFNEPWHWPLTVHTFFATCLVYQFSRWNFHKNYVVSESAQNDEIYQFIENHQQGVKNSIIISAIGTFVSCFFLNIHTLYFLGFLGCISLLYPLQIKGKTLRAIPYLKVFLIAIVWASIAVWMPYFELHSQHVFIDFLLQFIFFVIFIIFITLPFDKVDLAIDKLTGVKTLPALLGEKGTNAMLVLMALILIIMAWFLLPNFITFCLISALVLVLLSISVFAINRINKWLVMAIYDGSMILFFLIVFLLYGV